MAISKFARTSSQKVARINKQIKADKVRTIDRNGQQIGILPLIQALELAKQCELDLVEVAPEANPPVCKIMDFGKYRYNKTKKNRTARKKHHADKLKEIKIRPRIFKHDYEIKLNRAIKFLEKGYKVKLTLRFRRRELQHKELGEEVMTRLVNDLSGLGAPEGNKKWAGKNNMILYISPTGGQ
ncbi:MAG: translation initiation factor IF-3 [Candidatus Tritonobacter lacicola]|nr:translation initiation factor IF-3 [Candidatus Tritonobacter lacicola]